MAETYIIMGVSGAGKSTIGKLLAEKMQLPFVEGDDFHPQENIDKMSSGHALTNEDRKVWIERLTGEINRLEEPSVASCSALNEVVRSWIIDNIQNDVCFICLKGSRRVLLERLQSRKGHFFKVDMLDSQLNAFEIPSGAISVDIDASEQDICDEIIKQINAKYSK